MKLGKTFKCLRNFCYITCLVLFSVWLFNAVQNYLSLPTTTHAFVKYGDDNLKNATFPAVTFCRLPIRSGPESKLWNSIAPCVNNSILSRPFFLNYLEVCLESKTNLSVAELVENVSYNKSEALLDIRTFHMEVLNWKMAMNLKNTSIKFQHQHITTTMDTFWLWTFHPFLRTMECFPWSMKAKNLLLW